MKRKLGICLIAAVCGLGCSANDESPLPTLADVQEKAACDVESVDVQEALSLRVRGRLESGLNESRLHWHAVIENHSSKCVPVNRDVCFVNWKYNDGRLSLTCGGYGQQAPQEFLLLSPKGIQDHLSVPGDAISHQGIADNLPVGAVLENITIELAVVVLQPIIEPESGQPGLKQVVVRLRGKVRPWPEE